MSGSNRFGIKGAIASLLAAGALCTGSFAQNENCPNPKGGSCFEETPGIPGCQEEECCNLVCDINPDCCLIEWEQFCADLALEVCVCDVCGLPQCEDCFIDHDGAPYCNDQCSGEECAGCCLTICALDPYCCNVDWDILCVGEAEEFCLCKPNEIPGNDDCKQAFVVVGQGVFAFTTVCATHDGTDPEVGPCWDGFTGIAADVWFRYTPVITGPVRIHTCGGQADFDAKLAVYEGCVVCPPTEELLIECNDNGCGDGSEVIFEVVAGNCYTIRLGGGYLSPSGSGTFTIESIVVPANDDCVNAFDLAPGDVATFNTTLATTDGNPSPVCDFGAGADIPKDIWYDFTPVEDGTYLAITCGSSFNTKVAVYEGCGCPTADPIACNDDACGLQSVVSFDAVGGECYKIRVGSSPSPGAGTAGGVGQLSVLPSPAGLTFFFDQVSFDAAVKKAGKVLKGTEDFSENVLGKNGIDGLDDPLDINSSAPGTFPDGILIDNLTFQANTGGADSTVPAPHTPNNPGDEGLVLVTAPSNDVTADAVLANFFVDSYDILSGPPAGDSHTALGLTLVSLDGTPTVTVTVYDDSNVLLGAMASLPALLDGSSFFGILATEGNTIGRVNIFDPTDGAEGVYDVTAYVAGGSPCPWDLDNSGSVGATDLLALLVSWGPCPGCPADFDGNDNVGATDLLALLVNWGPCP